jgi:hypothetical protein
MAELRTAYNACATDTMAFLTGAVYKDNLAAKGNLSSEKAMKLMVGRSISGNPVSGYSRFGYCNRS